MKKRIVAYLSLYLVITFILFLAQKKFIYFPSPIITHQHQNIVIQNEGCSINVIVMNAEKSLTKAIVYFGGNAEAVAYNADDFAREFPDHIIYLVNYRGYGGSTGSPSESGFYSDALKVFESINLQPEKIVIFGRSLGSGVATYVASKREVSKLVLVTPFDSIQSVAQSKLWIFPMFIILTEKFLSADRVEDIKSKTLILIAENDEVIPYQKTQNLVNKFPVDQLVHRVLKNTGHNDISVSMNYYKTIREFLDQ